MCSSDLLTATLDGVSVQLTRFYNSLDAGRSGQFGYGWTLGGWDPNITTNQSRSGLEDQGVFNALREGTRLYVNLPDGRRVGFTFQPVLEVHGGLQFYRPAWVADAGNDYMLETAGAALELVDAAFYQLGTGLPYHPESGRFRGYAYALVSPTGVQYRYSADQQLREIRTSGGTLVASDSGILGPQGTQIMFKWDRAVGWVSDPSGTALESHPTRMLVAIIAPDGRRVTYRYDDAGNLLAVSSLDGARTWYGYDSAQPHLVAAVVGPEGSAGSTLIRYSAQGDVTEVLAIDHVLGVTRQFVGQTSSDSLTAGQTLRYAFVLDDRELATSVSGQITLGFQVASAGGLHPAAASVVDSPVGYHTVESLRSFALYTLGEAGVYVLEVAGVDAASAGAFDLSVYLAGDVNSDLAVNAQDDAAFLEAVGSTSADPDYRLGADANRDGVVTVDDRLYLDAAFGFIANQPPIITGASLETLPGIPVTIDLGSLATDPEGADLAFSVSNIRHGTVRLTDDGQTVMFTPEAGYTGPAGFDIVADDGGLASGATTVTIDVLSATLRNIRLRQRDLALNRGDSAKLEVVGEFSGGQEMTLPDEYVQYATRSASVAVVSTTGQILAVSDGTTIIVVTSQGLTAATPVTVGEMATRQLEFFPTTYAMVPGQTRQYVVREMMPDYHVVDRAPESEGTVYYVDNHAVGTITADGLFTATGVGHVYVTAIQGSQSSVALFDVRRPDLGTTTVGQEGTLVTDGTGITVGIGAGTLPLGTQVSVTPVSSVPMALPEGWGFGGRSKSTCTVPRPTNRCRCRCRCRRTPSRGSSTICSSPSSSSWHPE